jgi:hypothetical protein
MWRTILTTLKLASLAAEWYSLRAMWAVLPPSPIRRHAVKRSLQRRLLDVLRADAQRWNN